MIFILTLQASKEPIHGVVLIRKSKRVPEFSGMRTDRIVLDAICVMPFATQEAGACLLKASGRAPAIKQRTEDGGPNPWGHQSSDQGHALDQPTSVSAGLVLQL